MERELVERARRGDHDAFALLAAAAIDRLDSTARLILGDPDLAKDAVQEALFRAWRELPTLRDPDRFQGWLRRILVRACFGEGRRRRRIRVEVELAVVADPVAPGDAVSWVADRDALDRAFDRLEPEARAVIVLHHYLDLTLPDVAAALDVPLGTAKSRLHRATRELRAALEADTRTAPALQGRTA
jgi:RNA polymerase sigma factor (sigma-70 family)